MNSQCHNLTSIEMIDSDEFDDCSDFMNISFNSEYDLMEKMDFQFLDDIIREVILVTKRQSTQSKHVDEDLLDFTETLTTKDWSKISQGIQIRNCHLAIDQKTDVSTQPKIIREQKTISSEKLIVLEKEFVKCESPTLYRCNQLAKNLNLLNKEVHCWFKNRRKKQRNFNQSNSTIKKGLTLRLIRHTDDVHNWSVDQKDMNDCSPFSHKSSPLSYENSELSCVSKNLRWPEYHRTIKTTNLKNLDQCKISIVDPHIIKRPNKNMLSEQLFALENEFSVSQYVTITESRELAERLGLEEKVVRNWFYNKRRRLKNRAKKNALLNKPKKMEAIPQAFRQAERIHLSTTLKKKQFDTHSLCSSNSSPSWDSEDFQLICSDKFNITSSFQEHQSNTYNFPVQYNLEQN